ncbi:MAG: YgiW/YdeI family stress tolerance OB fold protein [Desulfovibrionaceae bacterium]|nr:YgiW/YdeI family stress tolerance OB fold protein [Desulfovibrionaceae bacterium]
MKRSILSRVKILSAASVMGAMAILSVNVENAAAQLQNNAPQGFSGPSAAPNTVAQAKEMWDDTHVVLKGNIIRALGGEHYTFRDQSGEITVEIDHEDWRGQQITPQDTVEIYGEVEKDFAEAVKIDVDRIVKI